jgi:pSer/pThr/pTyr-binding forkhead associated (FHA) protein
MGMKIVFLIHHQGTSEEITLANKEVIVIGREKGNLIIKDPKCSRMHAVCVPDSDQSLRLIDLNSSNGTFIDDKKITQAVLTVGSTFRIGKHQVECKDLYLNVVELEEAKQLATRSRVINNGTDKYFKCMPTEIQTSFNDAFNSEPKKSSKK